MEAPENENLKENHIEQAIQPEIQEEASDERQPLILDDQKSNIHNEQSSQIKDEQQEISDEEVVERQHEQEQQEQPVVNEQLRPRLDEEQQEQQGPQIPAEIRQVPNAAQQGHQRPQVVERQRQARQDEEQQEQQEQQIPDEVRQMPDALQQQMLKQLLDQSQRNNKMILFPILLLAIVMIGAIFSLKPPTDYVPRKEFDAFKTESQNGLLVFKESSRKSFSAQEAKYEKYWEEYLASMRKANPAKELPDKSIENLLEADRQRRVEISRLQAEVSDLKDKNVKLQKSLNSAEIRLQRVEKELGETIFKLPTTDKLIPILPFLLSVVVIFILYLVFKIFLKS